MMQSKKYLMHCNQQFVLQKNECLDLPDLMYQTREVPLSPQALRYYNDSQEEICLYKRQVNKSPQ
jgi:hypothetical protein